MIRAGVKKKFAEQFKLTFTDYSWFDLTCLVQLDADRVAKLEIREVGTVDSYNAIVVKICNRKTGVIDEKTFRFDDYLSFEPQDRVDDRKDYQGGFSAWLHNGALDWYIAKPKSVEPLTKAIEFYITSYAR